MARYEPVGGAVFYKKKSNAWIFWIIGGLILLGLAGSSEKKDAGASATASQYAQ